MFIYICIKTYNETSSYPYLPSMGCSGTKTGIEDRFALIGEHPMAIPKKFQAKPRHPSPHLDCFGIGWNGKCPSKASQRAPKDAQGTTKGRPRRSLLGLQPPKGRGDPQIHADMFICVRTYICTYKFIYIYIYIYI